MKGSLLVGNGQLGLGCFFPRFTGAVSYRTLRKSVVLVKSAAAPAWVPQPKPPKSPWFKACGRARSCLGTAQAPSSALRLGVRLPLGRANAIGAARTLPEPQPGPTGFGCHAGYGAKLYSLMSVFISGSAGRLLPCPCPGGAQRCPAPRPSPPRCLLALAALGRAGWAPALAPARFAASLPRQSRVHSQTPAQGLPVQER